MAVQSGITAFNIASSGTAQQNFDTLAQKLESLIDQRDADVKKAMAQHQADGSSEEYIGAEGDWNRVANQVRATIRTLRGSLTTNDETAATILTRARTAVESIH